MPTLTKETGAGLANANSYADVADGDAYSATRLRSTAWTGATTDDKTVALIMATRTIDSMYQFNGFKTNPANALQWPRFECPNPDANFAAVTGVNRRSLDNVFSELEVPVIVRDATCELAIALLAGERATDTDGKGIKTFKLEGALAIEFDKADMPAVVPDMVQTFLSKVGRYIASQGGCVKLGRA